MAAVSSEFKQLFLRCAKWDSEDAGATLFETLKLMARGRFEDSGNGSQIISTSANGKTVTFAMPSGARGLDNLLVSELCAEMLTRFDSTVSYLSAATDGSQDAEIYAQMLADIQPVKSFSKSYTSMRCAG